MRVYQCQKERHKKWWHGAEVSSNKLLVYIPQCMGFWFLFHHLLILAALNFLSGGYGSMESGHSRRSQQFSNCSDCDATCFLRWIQAGSSKLLGTFLGLHRGLASLFTGTVFFDFLGFLGVLDELCKTICIWLVLKLKEWINDDLVKPFSLCSYRFGKLGGKMQNFDPPRI